jgi:signal peptidase II|tara:strand:+ start:270 stop:764 length:495 start_codon:yes stop_codon:yes gene_type:complete
MSLNFSKKFFFINSILIFLIFILDRISKVYVLSLVEQNINQTLFISKYLNIHLIWNKGIAFGFFSFDEMYLYNMLTALIIVITLIVLIILLNSNGLRKYAMMCIFGGSLGNLYDRISYSGVPDFIDLHINEFHWFIFNIADIFITLGVVSMILLELFNNDKSKA